MNRWCALALLLAVAGALALRCAKLDARPMHNDEAVNAIKLRDLWQDGRYLYDPNEFHGPTLHYATLPFVWLSPVRDFEHLNEITLRLVPVAFGTGLILLLLLLADGLGRQATAWAAVFIAVSPAMVFYSRDFIHEMLLVFFTALTAGAAWRYFRERCARWAALAGAGVGLMFATKETFIINLGAMVLAAIATVLWNNWRDGRQTQPMPLWNWRHTALAALAAAAVSLPLFSSFFMNPNGLLDSIRTYAVWWHRAGGDSPHIHPSYFYLERLAFFQRSNGPVWSEALIIVLATVGGAAALFGRNAPLARFLAFYALILTAAYSLISYKTPWCMLSFLHGMILLAGVGASALVQLCKQRACRVVTITILLAATTQLAWQAWRASFVYFADRRNPYVYAQTMPDILRLAEGAEAVAKVHPLGHDMIVKVIAPDSDYWPLPWYLRRFKHTGWWDKPPPDYAAPLIVTSAKLHAAFDDKPGRPYIMAGLFELRPGNFMELYVEPELWRKTVETLPSEVE